MAFTVQAAFDEFYDAINLSGDHRTLANERRDHLISLLTNNLFVVDAFSTGSIPKYTALSGHADLDIFLVLHYGRHCENKKPSEVLQLVQRLLAYKTTVRRNGQAVTLHYTTWPAVDIVPVFFTYNGDPANILYYNVPDMRTETWIRSRPKEHAADIAKAASDRGENFRKIVKMVKAWNRTHGQYLESYHIEVLALKVLPILLTDLPWSVFSFFNEARNLLLTPLWHDQGFVDAYLGPVDRCEVVRRFDAAISTAREAWYAVSWWNNDHRKAITCWRQVFGSSFPSYG